MHRTQEDHLAWLLLVLMAVGLGAGCGEKKKRDGRAGTGSPAAMGARPAATEMSCRVDWSREALAPQQDTVDGHAFSVSLPKGLRKEVKAKQGDFPGYVTWNAKGNFFCAPGFTVQEDIFPPSGLEAVVAFGDKVILAKTATPQGLLVVTSEQDRTYIEVKTWRKNAAGKTLRFSIGQRDRGLKAVFDVQRAWMERVARTFAAK